MHPNPPNFGHKHKHVHDAVASSKLLNFVDENRLDQLIKPLVPDAGDRAFVLRCLIHEGPLHHRGSNYILLTLLAQLSAQLPQVTSDPGSFPSVTVPMRLPPYLVESVEDGVYPVLLPTEALSNLAAGHQDKLAAMIDCLTDGPSQHALANVVMVALIESMLTHPSIQATAPD